MSDDFAFPTRDKDDYANVIAAYLPNDPLFAAKNVVDSKLRQLITGLGEGLADSNNFIKEFTDDISPLVTEKFIVEWESAVGIPDECFKLFDDTEVIKSVTSLINTVGTVTATVTAHGYEVGDNITIIGANNTREVSALSDLANVATADMVIDHGFTTGDLITVDGATPAYFNVSATITVIDADTFTYPVTGTTAAATGTMTAEKPNSGSYLNGGFIISAETANTFDYVVPFVETVIATGTITSLQIVQIAKTNAERRIQILAKLSDMAVQTVQDFIDLGEFLGFTITVTPGFEDGSGATAGLSDTEKRYTIVITTTISGGSVFPYTFPFTFGTTETVFFECVFDKLAPANCQVLYVHNQ